MTTEEDRDPDGESKSPQSTPRGSLTAILPDAISEPLGDKVEEAQVLPSSGQSAAPESIVPPVSARSTRSSNSAASLPLRRALPEQPAEKRSPLASARNNAGSDRTDAWPSEAPESAVPLASARSTTTHSSNSSTSSPLRRALPEQPTERRSMLSVLAEVQSALPLASARNNAESDFDKTDTAPLTSAVPPASARSTVTHSSDTSDSSPLRRALPKQPTERGSMLTVLADLQSALPLASAQNHVEKDVRRIDALYSPSPESPLSPASRLRRALPDQPVMSSFSFASEPEERSEEPSEEPSVEKDTSDESAREPVPTDSRSTSSAEESDRGRDRVNVFLFFRLCSRTSVQNILSTQNE